MIGAVDIGGTKVAVGVVDDSGKVLARAETPTDPDNYGAGLDAIVRMLRQTAEDSGAKLRGIGIGSTGPIDPIRGEFGDVDFLPGWRGKSLVRDLEDRFKLRAALENDGDAAALAEAGWGAGRNRTRLIYITVKITEGEQYRISSIDFSGDLIVPKERLFAVLESRRGDYFSRAKVLKDDGKALGSRRCGGPVELRRGTDAASSPSQLFRKRGAGSSHVGCAARHVHPTG